MTLVATVIDPLTDPVPARWDEFVDRHRLLPLWRSVFPGTASWLAQVPTSMILVEPPGGGDPVALFHARHLGVTGARRFAGPGRMPVPSAVECRIMPGMMTAGMAFAPDSERTDRVEAVRVFERAVRRRSRFGGLAMAYRELEPDLLEVVPTALRVRMRLSPNMILANDWSDMAGYLATLPAKWRAQLRKIRREIDGDPTIDVRLVDRADPVQACWLAELVRRRHHPRAIPRPPLPALYFEQLADLPESRFLTYTDRSGRLLAFTAAIDTGTDLVLVNWGSLDESSGGRRNLYFDQYLRLIELMVDTGRHRLVLGKGMTDIKTRYGARPVPRWGVAGAL